MTRSSQIAKRCPDVSIFQQVSVVNLEVVWECKKECRSRAVLEAARFLSVALPSRLSLDLNDSPTSIQLGLHLRFCGRLNELQSQSSSQYQQVIHIAFALFSQINSVFFVANKFDSPIFVARLTKFI